MKWISVKDLLPKEYKDVLALLDDGLMEVSWTFNDIYGDVSWHTKGTVTHWRKLPNRPNKDN